MATKKPLHAAKKPPPKAAKRGKAEAPDFVEEQAADETTLEQIREQLRAARDAEARIRDLSAVVSEEQKQLNALRFEVLPEMFANAGVDNLGLPAEGNNPGYDAKMANFYRANIAASWDYERRDKAFEWLEKNGHGDLIKTEIVISLPRGSEKKLAPIKKLLKELKVEFEVDKSVHNGTLSAFVREVVEDGGALPLETLGATIGMVVNMKERK